MNTEKELQQLIAAMKFHEERRKVIHEFYKETPKKLSKEYYIKLKNAVFQNVKDIEEEKKLFENLREMIEKHEENYPEFFQDALESIHCTKSDALDSISGLIESLDDEINSSFDLLNITKNAIREVQEKINLLPPSGKIMLYLNPECNVDMNIMELEL